MAKFKIDWLERKETSTGKKKADVTLIEEDGSKTEVTIWGDFPNFENLMPGSEVEGDVRPASDPKYRPTLNAPRPTSAPGASFRQKVMDEAMEKKNRSISHFQSTKEESIKVSSTFRAAVDTAIAEYQVMSRLSSNHPSMQDLFLKWREYYWFEFEATEPNGNPKYEPFKG